MNKSIYFFSEADAKNTQLFGRKGVGLAEMLNLRIRVPIGFIITTEMCPFFLHNNEYRLLGFKQELHAAIKKLEKMSSKKIGDAHNPLILSVRSSPITSMPGIMDTILNVGMNDLTFKGLIKQKNNNKGAVDSYLRFIRSFSKSVHNVDLDMLEFHEYLQAFKFVDQDKSIKVIQTIKEKIKEKYKITIPNDPFEQLDLSIRAVFKSSLGRRATIYRNRYNNDTTNTNNIAVIICEMIFGNMGQNSASGVLLTTNPHGNKEKLYGDFLFNSQGDDIVTGMVIPEDIQLIATAFPKIYGELLLVCKRLEKYYKHAQEIEITIEQGKLYILQTRNAINNKTYG